MTANYILPLFGECTLTETQKLLLCFLEDETYSKWMEVFDAWELEKLIGEDGKKLENIPKVTLISFCLDITINDVNWTIGLRDLELFLLVEVIWENEVTINSNKILCQQ
jgi:hypothetical protein